MRHLLVTLCLVAFFSACLPVCFTQSRVTALAPVTPISKSFGDTSRSQFQQQLVSKFKQSWPWYLARGAGLIAAALLILLILSGIGMITGFTYRFIEPIAAWSLHRAIALSFGFTACLHVFILLFDKYVGFSMLQLLLPFSSSYKPITVAGTSLGSLYVALGVYAFYIMIIVIVSSLFWKDKKPYLWQALHYLSYLLVILVFVHAVFLGTDLQHGVLRMVWIGLGVLVLAGMLLRLRRSGSIKAKKQKKL